MLGFLPPIIGGIISSSMDASSGMTSARMSRTAFQNRYQDTVRDMRKAGLNPALAYGQGGGSGAQGQTLPELGSSFARGAQAAGTIRQSAATAELTSAQSALLKAQSIDLIDQVRLRNELLKQETKLTSAKTATEEERPRQIRQAILEAQIDTQWKSASWDTRMELLKKHTQQAGLNITTAELQNILLRLQQPEARATANFYEGAGQYRPYISTALDVLRTLMPKVQFGAPSGNTPPTRRIGK